MGIEKAEKGPRNGVKIPSIGKTVLGLEREKGTEKHTAGQAEHQVAIPVNPQRKHPTFRTVYWREAKSSKEIS